MKVRGDFVTNSSSSSFVTLEIDNPLLVEILDEYQAKFIKANCAGDWPEGTLLGTDVVIDGTTVRYASDGEWSEFGQIPERKADVIPEFTSALSEHLGNNNVVRENPELLEELISELTKRKKELSQSLQEVEWTSETEGWDECEMDDEDDSGNRFTYKKRGKK